MAPRTSRPARRGTPAAPALDAALRLLGRRPHSRAELRRKLQRRGYAPAEVAAAEARLLELGYLDDAAFAAGHVRRRQRSLGPLALAAELAQRGVDRVEAGRALAAFDREAQEAVATRLAERLYRVASPPTYRQLVEIVGPKLQRRGFSAAVVRAACRAAWSGTRPELEA